MPAQAGQMELPLQSIIMRPIIGITPDFNPGDEKTEPTYFLRSRYINAVEECGGIPIILPQTNSDEIISTLFEGIDGLMLTGSGPDIDPAVYGGEKRFDFKVMSRERMTFELRVVKMAMEREMPIIGICGGMQMMNVAAGGSLYQDIRSEIPGSLIHQREEGKDLPTHPVTVKTDTLLFKITNIREFAINSSHHQCINGVAPDFKVNAISPDGVIEGIEWTKKGFAIGLQWHPEYLHRDDPANRRIIEAFVRQCGYS